MDNECPWLGLLSVSSRVAGGGWLGGFGGLEVRGCDYICLEGAGMVMLAGLWLLWQVGKGAR